MTEAIHWLSLFVAIVAGLYFLRQFIGWMRLAAYPWMSTEIMSKIPIGMIYLWICLGSIVVFWFT